MWHACISEICGKCSGAPKKQRTVTDRPLIDDVRQLLLFQPVIFVLKPVVEADFHEVKLHIGIKVAG